MEGMATQVAMGPAATPPRPQVVAPTLGVYVTISGNAGPGLQVRPQAAVRQWTPQQGPYQQLGLDVSTVPSGGLSLRH